MPKAVDSSGSLGLWAIVAYGLGYITPTVLFPEHLRQSVTKQAHGCGCWQYLVALVVISSHGDTTAGWRKLFPTASRRSHYAHRGYPHPKVVLQSSLAALLTTCLLPLVTR